VCCPKLAGAPLQQLRPACRRPVASLVGARSLDGPQQAARGAPPAIRFGPKRKRKRAWRKYFFSRRPAGRLRPPSGAPPERSIHLQYSSSGGGDEIHTKHSYRTVPPEIPSAQWSGKPWRSAPPLSGGHHAQLGPPVNRPWHPSLLECKPVRAQLTRTRILHRQIHRLRGALKCRQPT
jgi:hypothetical protein